MCFGLRILTYGVGGPTQGDAAVKHRMLAQKFQKEPRRPLCYTLPRRVQKYLIIYVYTNLYGERLGLAVAARDPPHGRNLEDPLFLIQDERKHEIGGRIYIHIYIYVYMCNVCV